MQECSAKTGKGCCRVLHITWWRETHGHQNTASRSSRRRRRRSLSSDISTPNTWSLIRARNTAERSTFGSGRRSSSAARPICRLSVLNLSSRTPKTSPVFILARRSKSKRAKSSRSIGERSRDSRTTSSRSSIASEFGMTKGTPIRSRPFTRSACDSIKRHKSR